MSSQLRIVTPAGPNRWIRHDRFARLREIIGLLLDPMAIMLAVAATVYFLLGETRDAVVLALALIPVLGVDVVLEARSRAALAQLARAAAPFADVERDGHIVSVPFDDVVPGDVLVLHEGHVIAADGVVRWAANLAIDESSLTGESEPQSKRGWISEPENAPAETFRVSVPARKHVAAAIAVGVLSVGWRLIRITPVNTLSPSRHS